MDISSLSEGRLCKRLPFSKASKGEEDYTAFKPGKCSVGKKEELSTSICLKHYHIKQRRQGERVALETECLRYETPPGTDASPSHSTEHHTDYFFFLAEQTHARKRQRTKG